MKKLSVLKYKQFKIDELNYFTTEIANTISLSGDGSESGGPSLEGQDGKDNTREWMVRDNTREWRSWSRGT